MPVCMSFVMIIFGLYIYLISIGMLIAFFIPKIPLLLATSLALIFTIGCGAILYLNLIWKKRYKKLIEKEDKKPLRGKVVTAAWFLGAIILLIGSFSIMWATNNNLI